MEPPLFPGAGLFSGVAIPFGLAVGLLVGAGRPWARATWGQALRIYLAWLATAALWIPVAATLARDDTLSTTAQGALTLAQLLGVAPLVAYALLTVEYACRARRDRLPAPGERWAAATFVAAWVCVLSGVAALPQPR